MPRNPLEGIHRAMGAFLVERAGTAVPAHYVDSRREHAIVRRACGVFDLYSAGKIAVRGPEKLRFLDALLAADVARLAPGQCAYSLLLSRDGHIAGEMRVLVLADEVLLLTPSMARAKVRGVLERHVAASDVAIEDVTERRTLLSVQGASAAPALAAALAVEIPDLAPHESAAVDTNFARVLLVGAPRVGERGYDVIAPVETAAALFPALVEAARPLGGEPAGLDAFDALRVEAGIPAYGVDFDETTVPGEVSVAQGGLCLEKGCFLGREAAARVLHRGEPARRLVGVLFEGDYPPVRGDRMFVHRAAVGVVTSAAFSPMLGRPVALAMVATSCAARGAQLETLEGEPAVVARLPFWERDDEDLAPTL